MTTEIEKDAKRFALLRTMTVAAIRDDSDDEKWVAASGVFAILDDLDNHSDDEVAVIFNNCVDHAIHILEQYNEASILEVRKYNHYFKACPFEMIDVYRVLDLFKVTDPCLAHAVKKLLVPGGRSAGKSDRQDVQEAVATLTRWLEMQNENNEVKV